MQRQIDLDKQMDIMQIKYKVFPIFPGCLWVINPLNFIGENGGILGSKKSSS